MTDERFEALRNAITLSRSDPASLTAAMQPFSIEELRFFHSFAQLVETEVRGEMERREQKQIDDAKQIIEGT